MGLGRSIKYEWKLLLLLLFLVVFPCILLCAFAIQALSSQKFVIEQQIEQGYATLAANTRKQVIEAFIKKTDNTHEILLNQALWQNSPPVAILNTVTKDVFFKSIYLIDNNFNIIYPQERPKFNASPDPFGNLQNFPLFETAYNYEFQKKDFTAAIAEYQKIVTELQEHKLDPLGNALLGIARCHAKAGRPNDALQIYQHLTVLFRDSYDPQSLEFILDSRIQIANIYRDQQEMVSYYQTLLEALNTAMHYENCLSKAQYLYYTGQANKGLLELDTTTMISNDDRANLQQRLRSILDEYQQTLQDEHNIALIRQGILDHWKAQNLSLDTIGYYDYQVEEQQYLVHYRRVETTSFSGYVFYNINLDECLNNLIIPILQNQEIEKDVCFTIIQHNGNAVLEMEDTQVSFVVSQPLTPVFPFWQIAIYLKNVHSLEELSQYESQVHFLGIITSILILSVGVYVTMSIFLREIQSARFKSDFISNVTHELKTPLTSIKMFVETLIMERARTPEDKKECLQIISTESDRLSHLIDRILDLGKMQQRKRIFHFHPYSSKLLAEECLASFQKQIRENTNCHIELEIAPDLPEVVIDHEAMREVLLNLLSNAYKYNNNSERRIWVKISKSNPQTVTISIKDNGIGIPRHEFHRIFEKFYRIENHLTEKIPGSGLGLALVDSIVRAHKGEIELQSKVGVGSEFIVHLPVATTP